MPVRPKHFLLLAMRWGITFFNHIVIGIIATAAGLFIGFYFLYIIANWALARFQQRWHMRELWDWAAVPMLLLIFSILSTISQPIGSAFSRPLEHNADIYGLEVTHGINANSQEAAAHAFQVLGELSCPTLIQTNRWCSGMPIILQSMSAYLLPIATIHGAKASSRST